MYRPRLTQNFKYLSHSIMNMANRGMKGGGWDDNTPNNQKNKNCFFIICSGSMAAIGLSELLPRICFDYAFWDGADSADVYCNRDGRIQYLGNINANSWSNRDTVLFPTPQGNGWVNPKTVAGFVETYNHLFLIDDGDAMPELAHEIGYHTPIDTKLTVMLLLYLPIEMKKLKTQLKSAGELGVQMKVFTPDEGELSDFHRL